MGDYVFIGVLKGSVRRKGRISRMELNQWFRVRSAGVGGVAVRGLAAAGSGLEKQLFSRNNAILNRQLRGRNARLDPESGPPGRVGSSFRHGEAFGRRGTARECMDCQ